MQNTPKLPLWVRVYDTITGWLRCSVWTFVVLALIVIMLGGITYAGISSTQLFGMAIVTLPVSLLAGGLLGALVALPLLRTAARMNAATRSVATIVLSLAALCAGLVLWGWTYATLTFSTVKAYGGCYGMQCEEMVLRHAVPPPLRTACLRGVPQTCAVADAVYGLAEFPAQTGAARGWPEYALLCALSLLSALLAGRIAWALAQPLPRAEALPSLAPRRPPEAWRT